MAGTAVYKAQMVSTLVGKLKGLGKVVDPSVIEAAFQGQGLVLADGMAPYALIDKAERDGAFSERAFGFKIPAGTCAALNLVRETVVRNGVTISDRLTFARKAE